MVVVRVPAGVETDMAERRGSDKSFDAAADPRLAVGVVEAELNFDAVEAVDVALRGEPVESNRIVAADGCNGTRCFPTTV